MKHLQLQDFSPDNYHLLEKNPDRNFSPERNYRVINQVIEENDKMQKTLHDLTKHNAADAADILASFAKYKLDIGGEKKLEQWLGPAWMSRIYGDRLIEKIRIAEAIRQQNLRNGNTLYGGNFYTK